MSATIHHLSNSLQESSTEPFTVNSSNVTQTDLYIEELVKAHQRVINGLNSTNLNEDTIDTKQDISAPIARIYPHIFDEDAATGKVRSYILKALENAQYALDSYGVPDFESMNTSLMAIAAIMRSAHPLTEFNESFGAVVSFLRRATLSSSSEEVTRSALNSLVSALQSIAANPMIDLDEACDLIDKLSNEGWRGEHGVVEELVAILFDELDTENNTELQASLFDEPQTEAVQERET